MKRNENFTLQEVAGKQLLIPVGSVKSRMPCKVIFSETAAFIWELLAADRTVAQLVAAITGAYDVSAKEAEKDICALLSQMRRLNLLVS